ncbi:hypothetical protein PPL_07252 [Heterostelium album PN500]|uniref:Uncharacterized protein n=1 Tax=Heterostelium pallidum (strain ATCC 26659 / Pp 5 / PN500) TaxID=670386 RepID=D3BET7_HETP5|nr:hypothetical protein PPL_07252 [Heterostelium album PN500]EFA80418.1 hypothetical protein PPL_07252 [Heterostelium album PN500]|eukprot:XP_020432538.1 hypothetical protein PPL_07252 [Heterostelium album PN500]
MICDETVVGEFIVRTILHYRCLNCLNKRWSSYDNVSLCSLCKEEGTLVESGKRMSKSARYRRNLKLRKQGLLDGNGVPTPKPKNPPKPKKEPVIPSYIYVCVHCDENKKWKDQKESSKCDNCYREALKEGIGKFKCECGHSFNGYIRQGVGSMCYKCSNIVMPETIIPTRPMNRRRKSKKTHSCQVCNGHSPCPLKASIGTKAVEKGENKKSKKKKK